MSNTILLILLFVLSALRPVLGQHSICKTCDTIKHYAYTVSYNEATEQAEWVHYLACKAHITGEVDRTDHFIMDPDVPGKSANTNDYRGSGYDRGHLMPAYDASWSATAMRESFYMSNISPQRPEFNREGWLELERRVRDWTWQYDTLIVVTGPVIEYSTAKKIGDHKVSVPMEFYKIIYDPDRNEALCFLMPNKEITQPLESYIVPFTFLEEDLEIDFFGITDIIEASSMW